MSVATRKKKIRIQIPQELSDTVMVASASTCCVCQKPDRPLHIHHIDENPANNDPNNLAVLCIECQHKTQIHGGFAKMLTAGMVRRHRDEWLRMVKEKKRALAGQVAVDVPRTMTPEQALRHAKYLRDLYVPFYDAVRIMKHVATQVSQPWGSETWDERGQRLSRELDEALETIGAMLPVLRVEPGSIYVCKEYDLFYLNWTRYVEGLNKQYEYALAKFKDPDHSIGFFRRLGTDNWRDSMNEHARGLQQAIQNHIQSFDNLT